MSCSPPRERGHSRQALSQFYGLDRQSPPADPVQSKAPVRHGRKSGQPNPYDINAAGFDPDLFVAKLVKEASLSQLMAQEGEVIRQIQGLDSDMQTLVYENYNKFIAATETIRKMRVDFRGMEEEMDQLATSMKHITAFSAQAASQKLLDSYVQLQAADVSLMLRKSVEARDWLNTVEPRNVRAVMKRVVEDVTIIDGQVGELYEEGQRKARSSDSSRRTFTASRSRSAWSSYGPSQLDSSLASNIQKLFSEKIDYFAPVQPSKVSVLTGIIKIALKTLLECVRLKTFSRFGLQQMQVDCHYLQLYLWRFVEDEAVVHHLLDEVMSSVLHRCLDQPPQLMEHSVVEVICDRG